MLGVQKRSGVDQITLREIQIYVTKWILCCCGQFLSADIYEYYDLKSAQEGSQRNIL